MMVEATDENALVISKTQQHTTNTNVSQKILEEEEYLSILESIVERDFYPELKKLKLRSAYIDALESNDLEKLRQIQIQLDEGTSHIEESSPEKFDIRDDGEPPDNSKLKNDSINPELTLDKFLFKNTSEDNSSFEKIMQVTHEKHKEKYAWLYQERKSITDGHENAGCMLKSREERRKLLENGTSSVNTWTYVAKNSLMYPPEGVELSSEEMIAKKGKKDKEICHENTRFKKDPFDSVASRTSLIQAAQDRANLQKSIGKVGVDGKLEQPVETPKVMGYSFVATPSPMPGVDQSPLMTWGAIEGTPLRLDATPAHLSQGPNFKITEPRKREQIAHSLAEKASKQHRQKRKKAMAATASIFSPKNTPRIGGLTSERLSKLTPAAQKLVKSSLSIDTDKSLRASYTPMSDSNKINSSMSTPSMKTPGSSRIKTPGSSRGSSITDNLLNIPDD